jgi:hypothetical protein
MRKEGKGVKGEGIDATIASCSPQVVSFPLLSLFRSSSSSASLLAEQMPEAMIRAKGRPKDNLRISRPILAG